MRVLETKRTILKQLTVNEIEGFYNVVKEDAIGKNLPIGKGCTYEQAQRWLKVVDEHWVKYGYGPFLVILKTSSEPIGYCGLSYIEELQAIEVKYGFKEEFWGNGYATETSKKSIDYAFSELNVDKIIGLTKPENYGSQNVLKKCGMQYKDTIEIFGITCKYFDVSCDKFHKIYNK